MKVSFFLSREDRAFVSVQLVAEILSSSQCSREVHDPFVYRGREAQLQFWAGGLRSKPKKLSVSSYEMEKHNNAWAFHPRIISC